MKSKTLYLSALLFICIHTKALNYYWVGGTGNWSDINHWATTSNGAIKHGVVPSSSDDVIFDLNANQPSNTSFTVTVNVIANCHNMTWAGAPSPPTIKGTFDLNIYGSSVLQTGMNCSVSNINYLSSNVGETITSNGVQQNTSVRINGTGTFAFTDNFYLTGAQYGLYLLKGGLNTNNNNVTTPYLNYLSGAINLPTTTTLTLGTSTVNVTGSGNNQSWKYTGTGTTLNAGTSHIYFTVPSGGNLEVQSNHIYYDVTYLFGGRNTLGTNNQFHNIVSLGTFNYGWNSGASSTTNFLNVKGDLAIFGSNTITGCHIGGNGNFNAGNNNLFDTLIFAPTKIYTMGNAATQIIKKVWSAITPDCSGLAEIKSSVIGSQSTFSFVAGCTATVTNVMLTDMRALGSLAPLPCTGFNMGNNTGFVITNPAIKNLYWIGGTGSWNDATHWALTSGASYPSTSGCVPTPIDNVFFDALSNQPSNTSFTTTIGGAAGYCHNMTWNSAPGAPLINCAFDLNIYGSSTLQTGMKCSGGYINYLSSNVGETITSNGVQQNVSVRINGSGTFALTDNFYLTNAQVGLYLLKGGLNTNNNTVTTPYLNYLSGVINLPTTTTLTLGTSTINVTGSGNNQSWNYTGTGTTLNAGTSHIYFTVASGGNLEVQSNHIYYDVTYLFGGRTLLGTNNQFHNVVSFGTLNYGWYPVVSSTTNFLNVIGNLVITGSNTITGCHISGNANFSAGNSNLFDTLIFAPTKIYTMGNGATQTIKKVWSAITPDCTGLAEIKSSVIGSQSTFSFVAGCTATVTNVMLTDMRALGSLAPLPCTGFDMGNNTGFAITNPLAKNLYWIGGTGSWNDATHWALTSGASYPSASGCVPTPVDDVFFDAGSNLPTNTSFTTTIAGAAGYCHNMTWAGAPSAPTIKGTFDLNIYGSSVLQIGMNCSVSNINYLSSNVGETITSNGVQQNTSVRINGTGTFSFTDNFYLTSAQVGLYLLKGGLNTNNNTVTTPYLNYLSGPINLPTTTTLTLGSSSITVLGQGNSQSWNYTGTGASLNAGTSHIYFTAGSPYGGNLTTQSNHSYYNLSFTGIGGNSQINGGTNTQFNNVVATDILNFNGGTMQANYLKIGGNASITGANTFTYCSIGGNGNINGNNKFDTLVLSAGKTYVLQASQTQTVTSKLYASGNPCFLLLFRSSVAGTRANLNVQVGTVNFDYGDIKDMNATGLALNYAGHTTDAGNNLNFVIAPPAGTGIVGLGPDLLLNCNQYPHALNTTQFFTNPFTSYLWNDGSNADTLIAADAGTYSVMVSYGNNCNVPDVINLTKQTPMPISTNASSPTICSGNATTLSASGVSTYTWDSGANTTTVSVTPSVTTTYSVIGTDSNGCIDTKTLSVTVNTTPTLTLSSASTSTICIGETINVIPTGASSYTLIPDNIVGTSFTLTPSITQTYSVVGDNTGCLSNNQLTSIVNVNPTPTITALSALSNTICSGLTTTLTASGATSYTWASGPASMDYTVTPFATTVYTLIGENATGCNNSASPTTLTLTVLSSPTLALTTSISTNSLCSGNSATITLSGASAGSTYTLLPNAITNTVSFVVNPTTTTDYTVIATDNTNGCVSTTSSQIFTTTLNVAPSPTISLSAISPSGTLCSGQSATLSVSGASTYTLVNTNSSIEPFVVTPSLTTTYTVSGTGTNGCSSLTNSDLLTTIIVNQTPTISLVSISPSNTLCSGQSATITVTGAATYTLQNTNITFNPFVITPTITTSYTIVGTSSNGCLSYIASSLTTTISVASGIALSTNATSVTCFGANNGAITTTVSPANTYTYTWSNGLNTPQINNLTSGDYTVIVSDINNCTTAQIITITEPPAITIVETSNVASCDNNPTGEASINITGGTPNYLVLWVNGQTGNNINHLSTGIITATITDNNGCVANFSTQVNEEKCLTTIIPQIITPNGDGKNDYFFINTISYFPNNKLEIYNRWGNLIYSKEKYDNTFDGKPNVSNSIGGGKLPASTYFVVFDFGDGNTEAYKGYLEVKY